MLAEGSWQKFFTDQSRAPDPGGEREPGSAQLTGVALGSDAFFPFGDNIERAHRSGVQLCGGARRLHSGR